MSDHERLTAYEADFERRGSREPAGHPCEGCGAPESDYDTGLCQECRLASLPTCQRCEDAPATQDLGAGLLLCAKCEQAWNDGRWAPDDDETEPMPGDDGHDLGDPVGRKGVA